jgi:uncharacterized protein YukE
MTSKSPARSAEDVDETALSYAEIKMLATGNPYIKEKMDLDIAVSKLKVLKQSHLNQKYELEDRIIKYYPQEIKRLEEQIAGYQADIRHLGEHTAKGKNMFSPMLVGGVTYTEKADAGKAIIEECRKMASPDAVEIGRYRGFRMELSFDRVNRMYSMSLKNKLHHTVLLGTDVYGNITRLDNALESFSEDLQNCAEQLNNTKKQLQNAKEEVARPFSKEDELLAKTNRLSELDIMLKLPETTEDDLEPEQNPTEPSPDEKPEITVEIVQPSPDGAGFTPLHREAMFGTADSIRELLEQGVYVDTRDNYGFTPLRYADQSGNTKTREVLLEYGADAALAGLDHSENPSQEISDNPSAGRRR